MDTVTAILRQEHDNVAGLIDSAISGDHELVPTIKAELDAHAKSEEAVVYPRFKLFDAEDIEHAKEEHDGIEAVLAKLVAAGKDEVVAILEELKEKVTHHVQEEETKVFPEAEQKISVTELETLGYDYQHHKESLK